MDRRAIEEGGIPGYTLMQRAGDAAFEALRRHWPEARAIAVLCGAGNNAGDGYVVARLARAAGLDVRVVAVSDPKELRGDAARCIRRLRGRGRDHAAPSCGHLRGCRTRGRCAAWNGRQPPGRGRLPRGDRTAGPTGAPGPRARPALRPRCGYRTAAGRPGDPRNPHDRVRRPEERLLPRRGAGSRRHDRVRRARARGRHPRGREPRAAAHRRTHRGARAAAAASFSAQGRPRPRRHRRRARDAGCGTPRGGGRAARRCRTRHGRNGRGCGCGDRRRPAGTHRAHRDDRAGSRANFRKTTR